MISKKWSLLLSIFSIFVFFGISSSVSADETKFEKTEIPRLVVGESYKQDIVAKDGSVGYVEVTKIEEGDPEITPRIWAPWHTRNNVGNGTYNINVVTGVINAGFTIKIASKKITSVWNGWHFGVSGISTSGSLQHNSSTMATYAMTFNNPGLSWTGGVRAQIQSGNLVTYWS